MKKAGINEAEVMGLEAVAGANSLRRRHVGTQLEREVKDGRRQKQDDKQDNERSPEAEPEAEHEVDEEEKSGVGGLRAALAGLHSFMSKAWMQKQNVSSEIELERELANAVMKRRLAEELALTRKAELEIARSELMLQRIREGHPPDCVAAAANHISPLIARRALTRKFPLLITAPTNALPSSYFPCITLLDHPPSLTSSRMARTIPHPAEPRKRRGNPQDLLKGDPNTHDNDPQTTTPLPTDMSEDDDDSPSAVARAPEKDGGEQMLERGMAGKGPVTCAVIQSTVPAWVNVALVVSFIFGGCCSNVFALEAIISEEPDAGGLITFTQFLVCAIFTLPNFFSISAGPQSFFLKPRGIPLRSWVIFTAFFLTVNLLNNCAFSFRMSVPLHIIVRSAGPVSSMIIGYLYNGKRYTRTQIASVVLLTFGVVGAAMADANAKGKSLKLSGTSPAASTGANSQSMTNTIAGFSILALAMILSAFQGVFADKMYARYGHEHWREALFYCHALSLPFFIPALPHLASLLRQLASSPSLLSYVTRNTILTESPPGLAHRPRTLTYAHLLQSALVNSPVYPYLEPILAHTPVKVFYLLLNALTQYFCIRGVHILAAKSSSLTVVIVLNVRKLVSLI
ncbi:golgi uridine diphosphate-N- acetylglucosamine transporter [Ascosphaera atra]|nr:golgi uridine diphosphate-N- acetylglucosamine transporter [Ascosphaera atra]